MLVGPCASYFRYIFLTRILATIPSIKHSYINNISPFFVCVCIKSLKVDVLRFLSHMYTFLHYPFLNFFLCALNIYRFNYYYLKVDAFWSWGNLAGLVFFFFNVIFFLINPKINTAFQLQCNILHQVFLIWKMILTMKGVFTMIFIWAQLCFNLKFDWRVQICAPFKMLSVGVNHSIHTWT